METAHRARGGRRHNLSLRHLAPVRGKRDREPAAAHSAFEAFYRENVASVYQYALAVLANPADAEDVTQQTFLNAYRAFERGERPEKPHNWLIKIAHNVCRMRWRQSARRPQELPLETACEPATPDDEKPALDEVLTALGRLPFNQRAALVMRELEDRSYAEIADVLGTSVSAVEALLFRARTNLRANRSALGALTFVPVPASLGSFFGGSGGGVLAATGAAVGVDVVLKAAAVVATGVVVGSLGYKSVNAVADTNSAALTAAQQRYASPLVWASPAQQLAGAAAAGRAGAADEKVGAFRDGGPELIRAGNGLRDKDAWLADGEAPAAAAAAASAAAAVPAAGTPAAGVPAVPGSTLVATPSPAAAPAGAASGAVGSTSGTVGSTTGTVGSTIGTVVGAVPAPSPPPAPPPPAAPPPAPVPLPATPVPSQPLPAPSVPSLPVSVPTLPLPPPPPILP
jgi:RNA polymerase sigma factor (sigma-70 family)